MESSENLIESEDEVKKLQELVKKLEKQNEVLRSKQKLNGDVSDKSELTQNNHQSESSSNSLNDRSSGGGFDDVDVLDVDNLSLKDEEDSWLYSSPKPPTPQQNNVNIYQWMRQDFDHPSPELESARKSLLYKLNEVARMNRSSSTPSLGSSPSPTKAPAALSRSTEESQKPYTTRPHQKQSLLSGSRLDNGTFTRPKKTHERPGPLVAERERGEDEAYHSLEGTTDVEKLARQQEESLRQSLATYTSPKRVIHNKTMSVASDTDNSGSPVGSNRSSPAQYDPESSFLNRRRNSFGSDNGTPPDSPRTVQQHSTPYYDSAPPRRGIPSGNRSRLQCPPPASHSSDSSLEHQSVGSMDDDLHQPPPDPRPSPNSSSSPASRLPGPGGFRAASPAMGGLRPGLGPAGARGASPQRSGLPTPRRGIPRPAPSGSALRSSLPTPRRSGIPSPRPTAQAQDESWRDGCF